MDIIRAGGDCLVKSSTGPRARHQRFTLPPTLPPMHCLRWSCSKRHDTLTFFARQRIAWDDQVHRRFVIWQVYFEMPFTSSCMDIIIGFITLRRIVSLIFQRLRTTKNLVTIAMLHESNVALILSFTFVFFTIKDLQTPMLPSSALLEMISS